MVKLLLDHKCNLSFSNTKKTETLNDNKGQTALYWIVLKMPDLVNISIN
jgi:hypothetical protein